MTREEELIYLADYEYNQRALKELEQYRAIGTIEELQKLKENHISCEDCAGCTSWKCDCANVRDYAIREFAERLEERIVGMQMVELQGEDVCPCSESGEECPYINQDVSCQYCAREHTIKEINEIAEEMRGGEKWETQLKIMKRKDVKRGKKPTKKCKKWFLMYWLKGLVFQGK